MEHLSIVVMSCDQYADTWDAFAKCFQHYWPRNQSRVYLVTDTIQTAPAFYDTVLAMGAGNTWTERLHHALNHVDTDYVLLLLDDFLLKKEIDEAVYRQAIQTAQTHDIGCVRLSPDIGFSGAYIKDPRYGIFDKGKAYRVSTVPGIWKRSYLLALTEKPQSAWDFERKASYASNDLAEDIIGTQTCEFSYAHAIKRGKWQQEGVNACKLLNIPLDFSIRPQRSSLDEAKQRVIDFVFSLNPELIVKIQSKLGK